MVLHQSINPRIIAPILNLCSRTYPVTSFQKPHYNPPEVNLPFSKGYTVPVSIAYVYKRL